MSNKTTNMVKDIKVIHSLEELPKEVIDEIIEYVQQYNSRYSLDKWNEEVTSYYELKEAIFNMGTVETYDNGLREYDESIVETKSFIISHSNDEDPLNMGIMIRNRK